MNREKAIEIFKRLKENAPNEMHLETVGTAQELFDMAIQALEQMPEVTSTMQTGQFDYVPIRQMGEWTDVGLAGKMYVRNCKCTNCGKWNIGSPLELPAYCGICGAKMTSDKYMLYGTEPYKEGNKE